MSSFIPVLDLEIAAMAYEFQADVERRAAEWDKMQQCTCIFCDEPIFDGNGNSVFGEVMHRECESKFFEEFDAAGVDIPTVA